MNPFPVGTTEYYNHEATQAGFKTVSEWVIHERNNRPICRFCGTPQGFAMGTGDCDCESDDGESIFIPNPNRDKL